MSLHRTNIYLQDDQLDALKVYAATRGASVATIVREAVDAYLHDCLVVDTSWQTTLHDLLDRVQSRIPPSITSEEIEAEITEAREEYRKLHGASRRH